MARKRNRGESLIETMFALLVGSLAVMLLATMISASAKLIRLGEESVDVYTENLNRMNDLDDADTEMTVKIQFHSHGDGETDEIPFDNSVVFDVNVKTKSFQDGAGEPVIAYEKVAKDTGNT